jgi:hydrogenase/urease accessory protein HupE
VKNVPAKAAAVRVLLLFIAGLAYLSNTRDALAHDARPLSILIVEQQEHTYRVDVRVPPSIERENHPEILWPDGCDVRSRSHRAAIDSRAESMLIACSAGLEERRIGIRYPLFNPSLSALFRFSPASGGTRSAVLPPDRSEWLVPPAANWRTVARDYLFLGVQHIWEGIDHLLFVAGLLMLARRARRIAIAVTGFTLAHSLTLSLSALGIVRLPVPPIEVGIALSILFLAREIARPDPQSLARRYPLVISCSFGLLHGFGFAAALRDAGLPQNEIATALLFFNAGVEVGQLAFIACVFALIGVALGIARLTGFSWIRPEWGRAEVLGGYALGLPASFWFLQRLQGFWTG